MRSRPRSAASPPRLSRHSPGSGSPRRWSRSSTRWPRRPGSGSLYLLAVLAVAIRRGQVAALAAAVLGVLTLNFFFIEPLHRLTIADSDNVVALGVLLMAALVVGRLAGQSRRAGRRGRAPAEQAAAREARRRCSPRRPRRCWAATDIVATGDLGQRRGAPAPASSAWSAAQRRSAREARSRCACDAIRARSGSTRQHVGLDRGRPEPHRRAARAPDRRRARSASGPRHAGAEAEAARQADAAKTVILHAISHDLRSPLTAIRTAAAGLREEETTPPTGSR